MPFDQIISRCPSETNFNRALRTAETSKVKELILATLRISPVSANDGKRMAQWCPKPGRALSNHEKTPNNQREIIFSKAQNFTRCISGHNGGRITEAFVKINRCSASRLYLVGSMKSILVEDCKNCTFVFSAVSCIVQISDCSGSDSISN